MLNLYIVDKPCLIGVDKRVGDWGTEFAMVPRVVVLPLSDGGPALSSAVTALVQIRVRFVSVVELCGVRDVM